jgi:hypothetical protein
MNSGEDDTGKDNAIERNLGTQPLDALMVQFGLTNHDIVAATNEPLTHKAIQRARKGRVLTQRTQRRVVEAMRKALAEKDSETSYSLADFFNYKS